MSIIFALLLLMVFNGRTKTAHHFSFLRVFLLKRKRNGPNAMIMRLGQLSGAIWCGPFETRIEYIDAKTIGYGFWSHTRYAATPPPSSPATKHVNPPVFVPYMVCVHTLVGLHARESFSVRVHRTQTVQISFSAIWQMCGRCSRRLRLVNKLRRRKSHSSTTSFAAIILQSVDDISHMLELSSRAANDEKYLQSAIDLIIREFNARTRARTLSHQIPDTEK